IAARRPTSSTSGRGRSTASATSRARARFRSEPSAIAPRRFPSPASSSSIERAPTPWPGGPATSCTSSAGATSASSTRGCPVGISTATPWRARTSPGHARESRVTATELAKAAQDAFAFVSAQPGVTEVEVFAASNATLLTRLNYTSHIPSNGVEEPKSVASRGLGLQVVFAGPGGGASIGFGSEAADLTVRGAERALAKARQAAVVDPEFVSLPRPSPRQARPLTIYHDQRLMALDDMSLLDGFHDEAGVEAAQSAVACIGGARVRSGEYTIVFGRQPVTDLINSLVVPACIASSFYSSSTPFLGRLGRAIASPRLNVYDDGAHPGFMGSKGITCEGLPTGRTDLIRDGVLVGCLSNWYETQRLLRDPELLT